MGWIIAYGVGVVIAWVVFGILFCLANSDAKNYENLRSYRQAYEDAVFVRTEFARCFLAAPVWPIVLVYLSWLLLFRDLFVAAFPGIDKKAKAKKAEKEEALAQDRAYPTQR